MEDRTRGAAAPQEERLPSAGWAVETPLRCSTLSELESFSGFFFEPMAESGLGERATDRLGQGPPEGLRCLNKINGLADRLPVSVCSRFVAYGNLRERQGRSPSPPDPDAFRWLESHSRFIPGRGGSC